MTGVMIIFAFGLSLVISYVEKNIVPRDNPYSKRKEEQQETETVNEQK
jgi:hypothetical protein